MRDGAQKTSRWTCLNHSSMSALRTTIRPKRDDEVRCPRHARSSGHVTAIADNCQRQRNRRDIIGSLASTPKSSARMKRVTTNDAREAQRHAGQRDDMPWRTTSISTRAARRRAPGGCQAPACPGSRDTPSRRRCRSRPGPSASTANSASSSIENRRSRQRRVNALPHRAHLIDRQIGIERPNLSGDAPRRALLDRRRSGRRRSWRATASAPGTIEGDARVRVEGVLLDAADDPDNRHPGRVRRHVEAARADALADRISPGQNCSAIRSSTTTTRGDVRVSSSGEKSRP